MNIDYIRTNLLAIGFYLFALFISLISGSDILLNIAGLFFLLFATPFAALQLFRGTAFSLIEKYFSFLALFFFIYSPLFFFLNQSMGVKISSGNILIANLIIFALALVATKMKRSDQITIRTNIIVNRRNAILFGAIVLFIGLHAINYHFYHFMPEWDGYADLIKIGKGLETHDVAQGYRGFFYASVGILSAFSDIRPYSIFTILFIGLHTSLLLVLARLIRLLGIRKKSIEASVYLLALSVPVINMETDMTRPQNVVIIFLPILVYFIFRFLETKERAFLILATVIAMGGTGYHEFFIFPLLTYVLWIALVLIRQASSTDASREKRIIAGLVLACGGLSGVILAQGGGFLQGVISTAGSIIRDISDISSWRLWFIGSYSSDGADLQMGWPGIGGAAKYYAYYLSPALLFVAAAFAVGILKKGLASRDPLIRVILPLLLVLFSFAEILPRINHLYLPERFWILMDILLILAAVPILKYAAEIFPEWSKWSLPILITFCLVGVAGSAYVAAGKKALTSPAEYRAAMWIKKNTAESSSFITQSANGPMINFFARRATVSVDPWYFLSDDILERDPKNDIDRLNQYIRNQTAEINSLVTRYTTNKLPFLEFADRIQEQKAILKKTSAEIASLSRLVDQPKYIVYSFDKFDTIYRDREWWMRENAYGADIEKFNAVYPLVYHDNGVYIWRVR